MKKETLLDQARTPDGDVMGLYERDGTYVIRLDGLELMSTRHHASEEKLAELACAPLADRAGARVLIGGLGLGFTLRAALAHLPRRSSVVVAELMEAVIAWNRNPAYPLAARDLADARVELVHEDVGKLLVQPSKPFDAILLDVDNSPAAFTADRNRRLYDPSGLSLIHRALSQGGRLAVWSAVPSPAFEKALRSAGFQVEVERCRSHATSGGWHTLFIGKKPTGRPTPS